MKALTLTQPWASLVATGAKMVETRSWSTSYRGPLAIHAAKGMDDAAVAACFTEPFEAALGWPEDGWDPRADLPRGAVLATVTLVDVVPIRDPDDELYRDGAWIAANVDLVHWTRDDAGVVWIGQYEEPFGHYAPGRFAWLLADYRPLSEPFPVAGHLGLWEWDEPAEVASR